MGRPSWRSPIPIFGDHPKMHATSLRRRLCIPLALVLLVAFIQSALTLDTHDEGYAAAEVYSDGEMVRYLRNGVLGIETYCLVCL